MIKMSISHSEMAKLDREIKARANKYEGKVKDIVNEGALMIESDAKKNVIGMIGAGMMTQTTYASGFQAEFPKGGISANVHHRDYYAPFVEFGTGSKVFINEASEFGFSSDDRKYASQFRRGPGRNATARPALFPAFYSNRDKIIKKLKDLDL